MLHVDLNNKTHIYQRLLHVLDIFHFYLLRVAPCKLSSQEFGQQDCVQDVYRVRLRNFIHLCRPLLQRLFKSSTTQKRFRLQHGYCIGVSRRSASGNCELRTYPRSLSGGQSGIRTRDPRQKGFDCINEPPRPTNLTCIKAYAERVLSGIVACAFALLIVFQLAFRN